MRVGIRTKQVAGVTAVVALAEVIMLAGFVASATRILLEDARSTAVFARDQIYQRTFDIVQRGGDLTANIKEDAELRRVLEAATVYGPGIEYALLVDPNGLVLADNDPARIGTTLSEKGSLDDLIEQQGPIARVRAIYTPFGRTFEVRKTLSVDGVQLGSIRVGTSTLLLRSALEASLRTPLLVSAAVLAGSVLMAVFLAGLVLRPIHVIRSGLARLGRGDLDVSMDLPADAELRELGESFRQVTARLAADRTELAGQRALESVVDRLEDAVALFGTNGALLFSNTAMEPELAAPAGDRAASTVTSLWPADHPYRRAVEQTLEGTAPPAPGPVTVPGEGERLVLTNLVPGADGSPIGVLLVSRNLSYLSQVESTLNYSRKLAALSRLTAGIAHEIKNPLNAAMIHLELLRMQLADRPEAEQYVAVITDQVRRLDEVVQGFMKFTRPEDLQLQPVELAGVFERLRPVLEAEAGKHRVDLRVDIPAGLPAVDGDPNLLEQAFLNLALNAYQAMPDGGRLRIAARESPGRQITIEVEDSGVGIAPEHLSRIFDLYFTTKPRGSGIGLSLVFRTIQLHDGDIEVQSTPGRGTTFRVQLKQAARMFQGVGN
jgi:nitrogen-specific signal transduction histidine kinase